MSQIYTDPKRESDPHALPNAEVWSVRTVSCGCCTNGCICGIHEDRPRGKVRHACTLHGADDNYPPHNRKSATQWFWEPCFPGCLPDGDPVGPFATEAEAIADAQDGCDDE